MRRELICAAILMAVAAVFWMQRDSGGRITAAFPDVVLAVLVLLAIGIAVRGLLRKGEPDSGADSELATVPGRIDPRFLGAAIVVLLAWAVAMSLIGFTISSVIAFVVIAQLIRRGRPRPRLVVRDTAVGVVLVVGCFLVFTRVLLVPLPVSVVIGM